MKRPKRFVEKTLWALEKEDGQLVRDERVLPIFFKTKKKAAASIWPGEEGKIKPVKVFVMVQEPLK